MLSLIERLYIVSFIQRSFIGGSTVIGASLSEPHSSEYYTEIPVLFACLPC